MFRGVRLASLILAVSATTLSAQSRATVERVRAALPVAQADRILDLIRQGQADGLPLGALEQVVLQGIAKGAGSDALARAVQGEAARLRRAKAALVTAGRLAPSAAELRAAADALRRGVVERVIVEIAGQAPPERTLAIPIFVLGSLTDRGVASDHALDMIVWHLHARASDAVLERLPREAGRLFAEGLEARDVARILVQVAEDLAGTVVPRNPGRGANPGSKRP